MKIKDYEYKRNYVKEAEWSKNHYRRYVCCLGDKDNAKLQKIEFIKPGAGENYELAKARIISEVDNIKFDDNNPFASIYESIVHIVNEEDKDKLMNIFNEINQKSEFKIDYLFTALLEDGLRNVFLNHINNETFKCEGLYEVIDGRYVVNLTVQTAVANAYGDFLMKRQYPFFVLYLKCNK